MFNYESLFRHCKKQLASISDQIFENMLKNTRSMFHEYSEHAPNIQGPRGLGAWAWARAQGRRLGGVGASSYIWSMLEMFMEHAANIFKHIFQLLIDNCNYFTLIDTN